MFSIVTFGVGQLQRHSLCIAWYVAFRIAVVGKSIANGILPYTIAQNQKGLGLGGKASP